ncbi:hypothetical protein BTO04_09145 [Polaribacter sp. SA4-10]|uniref:hypothetical protein n=1 Tax=Polaribacter sp. SA4-10 TaxID=754397 RepID=UPI000B3D3148|nr:hypothetical protein [Polaribacter sp. SA4-10]ARV06839.1 hypothetical protein BTO04_09145 [Polaribacter sp. SA4-10]
MFDIITDIAEKEFNIPIRKSKKPSSLALTADVYYKKIMGYNVSNSLNVKGSLLALEMALKNRAYKNEAGIFHYDRGLRYCFLLQKRDVAC